MRWPLRIPRHACSPRETSHAGDLWRLVQEAAVMASEEVGWPASRYKSCGTAFVVREMTGIHHREARYAEVLDTSTCVAEARRGILIRRETWVADVMRASVQWAHVDASGVPVRAGPELVDAFRAEPAPGVELPQIHLTHGDTLPVFHVRPWFTEMDPLGHTNHPRYIDWADEALCQHLAATGRDPMFSVPTADQLRFRGSAHAGDDVSIHLECIGRAGPAQVYSVAIRANGREVCSGRIDRVHG